MTAAEIEKAQTLQLPDAHWMREIAYQLAQLVEHFKRVDETVFGAPLPPKSVRLVRTK